MKDFITLSHEEMHVVSIPPTFQPKLSRPLFLFPLFKTGKKIQMAKTTWTSPSIRQTQGSGIQQISHLLMPRKPCNGKNSGDLRNHVFRSFLAPVLRVFSYHLRYWSYSGDLRYLSSTWVFPKIGVPQNGWFIMEIPIKMEDLGGTIILGNTHIASTVPYLGNWWEISLHRWLQIRFHWSVTATTWLRVKRQNRVVRHM